MARNLNKAPARKSSHSISIKADQQRRVKHKTENEKLYDAAQDAIDNLFRDTSVERQTAKENLTALENHIDLLKGTL